MTASMFTSEQAEQFEKQGYLLIPNFVSRDETKALLQRSQELLERFDVSTHPLTRFTTSDKAHVGDDYFLNSSDNISFFFEPDAFGDINGRQELVKPKEKAINKFGHGLHISDPLFHRITVENSRVKEVVSMLGFEQPKALQSMVICKQPEIGGAVPSHQDSVFLYTEPQTAVGFWIALENATAENGCLSFAPGSHRTHPITKRFVRKFDKETGEEIGGTDFMFFDDHEKLQNDLPKDKDLNWDTVECKPGDLVLIHGSVLHRSETNTSSKSRFAYAFHVIDGKADYDKLNWLQSENIPSLW